MTKSKLKNKLRRGLTLVLGLAFTVPQMLPATVFADEAESTAESAEIEEQGSIFLDLSEGGTVTFELEDGSQILYEKQQDGTITMFQSKTTKTLAPDKNTSVEEDIQSLNKLLNWMIHSEYNYYQEWLSETVDALQKSGQIKDKLIISGQTFDAVYFHLPTEPYGYLSNWYPSRIKLEGETFSSAEQYIMYKKCQMFGDQASAEKVLQTDDPAQHQDIGRKASGYVNNVWAGARQMIAYEVLLAKFTQNEDLKKKLLETGDAYLVECAGSDKIWACGIKLYDDDRKNASNWTGQNILGFTLMKVREHLRN